MGLEMFQSPVVIITALSLLASVVVTIYSLSFWQQRRMMHFAFLSLAVSINVLGYYLEVTSTTLEAAIVACKVAYVGIPLSGILLFMFSLDYSDRIRLPRILSIVLYSLAPIFTIAVFLYPSSTLFYTELSFSTEGLVSHLVVTPGILYFPCLIYSTAFSILAFINLVVSFFQQKRYEGAVIFVVAIAVPILVQFYTTFFGMIDGWNPQRTSMTISVVLLSIYLGVYRQAEWHSMGRDLALQNMTDALILLDNKGSIVDHNVSAEALFPELRKHRRRLKLEEIWDLPFNYLQVNDVHHIDRENNGEVKNLKVSTFPIEVNGRTTGTMLIINDDTVNTKLMQELTRMARIDDLTGLANRATFFHEASLSYGLAQRHEESRGCVLMIDIDFFKDVNDTYGHAMGDEVLTFLGALLKNRFRHTDICGRYGGEELSVWMPATSLDDAIRVAEEIRLAVESQIFECDGDTFNVTISTGIAYMHEDVSEDFDSLIKKADNALYDSKNSGRNRICVYDSASSHVRDTAED